jgi:hypothetical protein
MLLLMAVLVGCVDANNGECPVIGDEVEAACGAFPNHPGGVTAFDGDNVTMSRTTYDAIEAWHTDVNDWSACALSL